MSVTMVLAGGFLLNNDNLFSNVANRRHVKLKNKNKKKTDAYLEGSSTSSCFWWKLQDTVISFRHWKQKKRKNVSFIRANQRYIINDYWSKAQT